MAANSISNVLKRALTILFSSFSLFVRISNVHRTTARWRELVTHARRFFLPPSHTTIHQY